MSHIKINDITPRIQYEATLNQVTFPIPFPFFQDDDIKVLIGTDLTPISTALYTISGAGDTSGGSLVFDDGQPADTIVTLYRD